MVSFVKSFGRGRAAAPEPEATSNTISRVNTVENADGLDTDEKGTPDHQHATALAFEYVPGSDAEKRLLRKLDFRLLPCCWVLYILGYLDRSNIGNAKTAGMQDDFSISSNQYSVIVLIFFVSYTIFEIPSNMILVRVRPSLYLAGLAVLWGISVCAMAATRNWKDVVGCRFVLGAVESGFAAGCAFYLSSWYRTHELAARYAIIYTSVALAGGLSGLLAGAITDNMDGAQGIIGWKWLFIIEGAISGFAGIVVLFFLPDYPSAATRFLNEDERILACHRLALDGIGLAQGAHERMSNKKAFMLALKDWRMWAFTLLFMLVCGSQTMQYFIPSLVEAFGWEGAQGQYHTIPGYMFAVVCILVFCFVADYYKNKWITLAVVSGVGTVLFTAVTAASDNMARYVIAIFAFGIIYGCSPLVKTWAAEVIRYPAEKRAVAIAFINSLGNASSIYGSWLWPDDDAPAYRMGFGVTTAWMGCLCIFGLLFAWLVQKYPTETPDAVDVVAAELRQARQKKGVQEEA